MRRKSRAVKQSVQSLHPMLELLPPMLLVAIAFGLGLGIW